MKVSEPKMPEPIMAWKFGERDKVVSAFAVECWHKDWQAYAAGIRAAVLAEVRAVVPVVYGSKHENTYQDGIKDGRADAYNRIRDTLATLEQSNG